MILQLPVQFGFTKAFPKSFRNMEGVKNFRISFKGFLIEIAIREVAMLLFYPVQILKILNPTHHIIPKIPANNQIQYYWISNISKKNGQFILIFIMLSVNREVKVDC